MGFLQGITPSKVWQKTQCHFQNFDENDEANEYNLTAEANSASGVLEIINPNLVHVLFSESLENLMGVTKNCLSQVPEQCGTGSHSAVTISIRTIQSIPSLT